MGATQARLRNSGCSSLLMREAIRFASSVTEGLDCEGFMAEPIERFFRGFGATAGVLHRFVHEQMQ
jgi:hypothetical protein